MMTQQCNFYLCPALWGQLAWRLLQGKRLTLGLLLMLCYSGSARAEPLYVNCERNSGYYQYFDTVNIEFGRDSAIGDVLGPWVSSYNNLAWRCTPNSNYQLPVQFSVQGYPPYTSNSVIEVDGKSYRVYNHPINAGLGYIVRWRYTLNGATTDWQPLTIATGGQQTHAESVTVNYTGSQFYLGVDAQVRFVKTANSLSSGAIILFDPIYMRHLQTYNGSPSPGDMTYMIAQFKNGGAIAAGGTCTTPNVNVDLPETNISQFSGVGSVAGRKAFNLQFNQCPAGLASIGYSFAATTAVLDAGNGVVAPNETSTANGVGIQLLHGDNTAVTFDRVYPLDSYDAASVANYRVPMLAGLYQTGNTVSVGSANSAITFTLNYK